MGRCETPVHNGHNSASRGASVQNVAHRDSDARYLSPPRTIPNDSAVEHTEQLNFEDDFASGKWDAGVDRINNERPKRRALVIAISYGTRFPPTPTRGAFADASKIISLLTNVFGYPEDEICVLTDVEDEDGYSNSARYPSRDNIEKNLEWLCKGSKAGDYRFLFFGGHAAYRTEKTGLTYEGIMPADVKFRKYRPCEDCTCGADNQVFELPTMQHVIVHPSRIVWSQTINSILTSHLADGANLTAVFDCDAGGNIPRSSFPFSRDAGIDPNIRGRRIFPLPTASSELPSSRLRVFRQAQEQEQRSIPLGGNILCLPTRNDIKFRNMISKTSSFRSGSPGIAPDASSESAQMNATQRYPILDELACAPYLLDVKVRPFSRNCRVHCWAACRHGYNTVEDGLMGGRFTKAFTELLQKNSRITYREFNLQINETFNEWNSKTEFKQNPQFYSSGNVIGDIGGLGEKMFEDLLTI